MTANKEEEYWFNLKTKEVEVGKQSPAVFRIGPFKSRDEARAALQLIQSRTTQWQDDEDKDL